VASLVLYGRPAETEARRRAQAPIYIAGFVHIAG